MTDYTRNLVMRVPASKVEIANHLSGCLGLSEADMGYFTELNFQDSQGNQYAIRSAQCTERVFLAAQYRVVELPAWDTEGKINLEFAQQAMDSAVVVTSLEEPVDPEAIVAVFDIPGLMAVQAWGLTRIETQS